MNRRSESDVDRQSISVLLDREFVRLNLGVKMVKILVDLVAKMNHSFPYVLRCNMLPAALQLDDLLCRRHIRSKSNAMR